MFGKKKKEKMLTPPPRQPGPYNEQEIKVFCNTILSLNENLEALNQVLKKDIHFCKHDLQLIMLSLKTVDTLCQLYCKSPYCLTHKKLKVRSHAKSAAHNIGDIVRTIEGYWTDIQHGEPGEEVCRRCKVKLMGKRFQNDLYEIMYEIRDEVVKVLMGVDMVKEYINANIPTDSINPGLQVPIRPVDLKFTKGEKK